MNRIDPNGMDWQITTEEKDGKTIYHITVNAVLYNNSSTNYDSKTMNSLADKMKDQVNNAFNVSGDGYSVDMKFNLKTVTSADDIKLTDHVFQIVDQGSVGSDLNGNADVNGLNIKMTTSTVNSVLTNKNNRTIAHELGHTGGLLDANLYQEQSKNLGVDLSTNLMSQSKYVQRVGGDFVNANDLTRGQINAINSSYLNGNLNTKSPVYIKSEYTNTPYPANVLLNLHLRTYKVLPK